MGTGAVSAFPPSRNARALSRAKDIMQFQFSNARKGQINHAIFPSHGQTFKRKASHSNPTLSRRELQRIVADMID